MLTNLSGKSVIPFGSFEFLGASSVNSFFYIKILFFSFLRINTAFVGDLLLLSGFYIFNVPGGSIRVELKVL